MFKMRVTQLDSRKKDCYLRIFLLENNSLDVMLINMADNAKLEYLQQIFSCFRVVPAVSKVLDVRFTQPRLKVHKKRKMFFFYHIFIRGPPNKLSF